MPEGIISIEVERHFYLLGNENQTF